MYFPQEIWNLIIEYTGIHKNIHKKKLNAIMPVIHLKRPAWIWHTHYSLKTDIYEIQLYNKLDPTFFFDFTYKPVVEKICIKGKDYNFETERLDEEIMNLRCMYDTNLTNNN